MGKRMIAIVTFLIIAISAEAGRIFIPKDENVLHHFNSINQVEGLDPEEINVLVWNIYKGENTTWKNEFFRLTKQKDLLLIQESMTHSRVSDELRRMPWMEFVFATSWYNIKYLNSETGVMTGSTSPSIESKWQRSYYLEPILHTPKMLLFTKYKVKGKKEDLLVANIHGINVVRAYKLRHMLDKAAEVIKEHTGPVIFAGDFNTWTKTKINNMRSVLKRLGLKAVKFKNDIRTNFRGNPLDHTWVRGFDILNANVPNSSGSDHMPMTLKLKINGK